MSLLQLEGLCVQFGGLTALDQIDLSVEEGALLGLIGPNGAGKTTLINAISGLRLPTAGRMRFGKREGGPWPIAQAVRLGIARTFQQTRVFMGLTVRENFQIAALTAGVPPRHGFELEPVLDRVARELPYSLLRQLGVLLALSTRPRLLLLDEPAVGLTGDEVERMAALIRQVQADGVTIILVEHNVRFLMDVAQRVCVLDRGRLVFDGTPADCQVNPQVIDIYLGRATEDA